MFDLIDRLERLGPSGAPLAVGIGIALALCAAGLIAYTLISGTELSHWALLGIRGGAFFAGALSMVFGMVGVRLHTATAYPDPADVFPSMGPAEFRAAMYAADRPLAACSDCLIHLPATFSTGSCPRCGSSIGWHHIHTDEDADLVCSALHV